jgi:hypothetical protein
VLRYDPPVQRTGRLVQQELEFGGAALRGRLPHMPLRLEPVANPG